MRLSVDENGRAIQAVAVSTGSVLSSSGATATATDDGTMYLLSAVSDTYWAVILGSASTSITSSNGNYLKTGAYIYVYVPNTYKLKVDSAGSATAALCF